MWALITIDIRSFARRATARGQEWCPSCKWPVWYKIITNQCSYFIISFSDTRTKCPGVLEMSDIQNLIRDHEVLSDLS